MTQVLLALDFGGTKLTAGVVQFWAEGTDPPTAWEGLQRLKKPPDSNATTDIQIISGMADELLAGREPLSIGVSFGGPVDRSENIVRLSHHVPGWENIRLGKILQEKFSTCVQIDNDANTGAIGEHNFGVGRNRNSLLYITVSTGIGGGWILNQQLWTGSGGMAGEIGHMVIHPDGPQCLCGKKGCLERFASGPYIAQDMRQYLASNRSYTGLVRDLVKDNLELLTAEKISMAANNGDIIAQELILRAGWALGIAIGNTANLINPELFILGGGVMKSGDFFWERIRETARSVALPQVKFEITAPQLGDDSPLWGAVFMARQLVLNQ